VGEIEEGETSGVEENYQRCSKQKGRGEPILDGVSTNPDGADNQAEKEGAFQPAP